MQSGISLTTAAHLAGGARTHGPLRPTILPRARRGVDSGANAPKALKAADCPSVYRIIVLDDLLAPHGTGLTVLRESGIRNPHARLLVVTTDGAIIRNAGGMRMAVSARLGKRFGQLCLWPPLRPIEYRIPEGRITEGSGRGDGRHAGSSPMPGFAAPEQRWDPKAPASRDDIRTGPEIIAAVDGLVEMPLAQVERLLIEATIQACGDSLPQAARVLGVSPSTLYRKRAGWSGQPGGR